MLCTGLLSLCYSCFYFFFFKQKTAYEMRISDWSSDVCSSDLAMTHDSPPPAPGTNRVETFGCRLNAYESEVIRGHLEAAGKAGTIVEIGRASCRERVCQYV